MKRYEKYKDSRVEWIGDIPEGWEVKQLKYIVNLQGRIGYKGFTKEDFVNEGEGCLVLGGKHIDKNNRLNLSDTEYLNWDKYYESPEIMVKKGDLIISQRGTLGKCLFIDKDYGEMTINPSLVLVNKIKEYPQYIWYNLQCEYLINNIKIIGSTTTIPMLSQFEIGSFKILVPPLKEQEKIVEYLDEKTSYIDKLLDISKRKIGLLKEQRASIINQVITKGLNPNAKMKNSGVEWIGDIPEGWGLVKVGYYTNVVRGGSPRPSGDPRYFNGDFINWITVKEVTSKQGKYIIETDTKLTEAGMKQSRVLEPETLVLSNSGATLGIPGILKIKGCINDGVVSFLNISPLVVRDFLFYFWTTQTSILLEQQSGYGQPNLNIDIVSNIKFPLPPLIEQEQIVAYLDEKTSTIDKSISIEERRIGLLKEYRQSIISQVITGKIKVLADE